jgi:ABC-type Fe3+/spermidine/putrescine transport system ATPase subunit
MTSPFVRLNEVTKRHHGGGGVVNVSLDIRAGESIVILGPSGSGKTTLLRLVAGLEVPEQGSIWLDGQCVAEPRHNIVPPHRRQIGLVFQDLALWPHLSVRKNLEFVVSSVGLAKRQRLVRVLDTLALCRIDSLLFERFPHQLSGGEQQRVALARALVASPRLLLLDEPFSSLDPELRVALRSELVVLQRQLRITTISVTHDREDASVLADRIVVLRAGTVDALATNRAAAPQCEKDARNSTAERQENEREP